MSWMQKLFETYEACEGKEPPGSSRLLPIAHTTQQAHIEIVLDGDGRFKHATVLNRGDNTTLIPCTEESGGRSGKRPVSHPLSDKLQYVAGDYVDFGGEVTVGFANDPREPHREYLEILSSWCAFSSHPKLKAIHAYVIKGTLVADLIAEQVIPVDITKEGVKRFSRKVKTDKAMALPIFKVLSADQEPEDAFVRWRVEIAGDLTSGTWEDESLIVSWINYRNQQTNLTDTCLVTGNATTIARQHPSKIRHSADKAKLISSNDTSGFTFRGRFLDARQAAGVGLLVTQKAHNALIWLINRQAYRNGEHVVLAWSPTGKQLPDIFADSSALFADDVKSPNTNALESNIQQVSDVGQAFAKRLSKAIAGYRQNLSQADEIAVMGLDSATPGRLAITFYRELTGSEFLNRIESWHLQFAWEQNFGNDRKFVGAPAPTDIAEVAYGLRMDEKLKKSAIQRLLPCIIDGRPLPYDFLQSSIRRTSHRSGMEAWEWERCLGVACGLYRGFNQERRYSMTLEEERASRDYLYGRLLAIADSIERLALTVAEEKRETTAERLMQRFADRPFSTWRSIELALAPYKARLRAARAGALARRERVLDSVSLLFDGDDFTDDKPLSGEFLLGFHCQRAELRRKTSENDHEEDGTIGTDIESEAVK